MMVKKRVFHSRYAGGAIQRAIKRAISYSEIDDALAKQSDLDGVFLGQVPRSGIDRSEKGCWPKFLSGEPI